MSTVLRTLSDRVANGLNEERRTGLARAGITAHVPVVASLVGLHLGDTLPHDYASAQQTDEAAYAKLFHNLLDAGIAIAPGAYEILFPGLTHTPSTLTPLTTAL